MTQVDNSSEIRSRKVFLTGATGAMGLAITRALVTAGHDVIGVTRSAEGRAALEALGARPVQVDLFDAAAVRDAMQGAGVVAHFATRIPEGMSMARLGAWKQNDKLRTQATRNLLAGAEANGISRFIFESIALAYPDCGDDWIDEDIAPRPSAKFMRSALEAEEMLRTFGERGGEPVSLRFPRLYGPGRASRSFLNLLSKRQMPIAGPGHNLVPSIHVADAASAVVAALRVAPGVYNICDDEPVRQDEYLSIAAKALGAPAPRRLPGVLARVLLGAMAGPATASLRVSNARFRRETGWAPRYASVREGWPAVIHENTAVAEAAGRVA